MKNMIRITQIKCPPGHTEGDLEKKIRKILHLKETDRIRWEIVRQSVDARKKPDIFYVYVVDVILPFGVPEKKILNRCRNDRNVSVPHVPVYQFPSPGTKPLLHRPVIVGSGPAGLFCALLLAEHGYRPILLERGMDVDSRKKAVEQFWAGGPLDPETNVQFGEGGAGTFSDGKLNSVIKDPIGRVGFVLKTFVKMGADEDILYSYKPHIGTDRLTDVVRNMRGRIISCGGEVLFRHCLTDLSAVNQEDYRLTITAPSGEKTMTTRLLVLATGHSARDTIRMLSRKNIPMKAKPFAVGVRVQHTQKMINEAMYGPDYPEVMPAAPYKLTCNLEKGSVYSFCMCPGGYVVDASSEAGRLAVNGMSLHSRDGVNANSAIVVSVSPEQCTFDAEKGEVCSPLDGIAFQEELERRAFEAGGGSIPTQRYGDFLAGRPSLAPGSISPQMRGSFRMTDLRDIFPERICSCLKEGMASFGKIIPGFDQEDTLMSAVESRTSSPVRIERDENLQIPGFDGIFPCGEGAGYAGGITSAAVDGMRTAEVIARTFAIPSGSK